MIEELKVLLKIDDTTLIEALINETKEEVVNYCNLNEYDNKLDFIVKKIVRYKFNRLGYEGLTSQNYSGVSESYTADYEPSIYKALNKHRRLSRK